MKMANTPIHIRCCEPVLMIDMSYYIFHRFFATQRWFSFQDKEAVDQGHTLCDRDDFMTAYKKHFLQDLEKFGKKIANKTKNPILFLKDCPRSAIWRNEHVNDYKSTRILSNKMDTRIFNKTYEWVESTLDKSCQIMSIDNLEADDLAYLFKVALRSNNPRQEIRIISNDNDYFQLYDDSCIIYNASLKNIKERCKYGCPQKEKRLKILLGDKSDNIKPCMPSKFKKHIPDCLKWSEEALYTFLQENELYEKFCNNKKLVDLSCIPDMYQDRFFNKYRISNLVE